MKQTVATPGRPRRLAPLLVSTGVASVLLASTTTLIADDPAAAAVSTDPLISTTDTTWRYLDDNT